MKISFSTIGCPDWTWEKIVSEAVALGVDGIEVRGVGSELYAPQAYPFQPEYLMKTQQQLEDAHLCISMLTSGASLGTGESDLALNEARDYVDLAARLHVPYVRVMICSSPEPSGTEDVERCSALYGELCRYAEGKNVTPLIETNGILGDSAAMLRFIECVPGDNKGILWDVHHPYRFFKETPERTYGNIGPWVRHVHLKDSVGTPNGGVEYRMLGSGDVPVFPLLRILTENKFDGFVSLEWVKRWCPELQGPEMVFAQFMNYMRVKMNKLL